MPIRTTKQYQTNYLNLDYVSLRDYILQNFIKKYFPDTYNDWNINNPSSTDSIAQMLIEVNCAIGDILSFYINDVYKETNPDTAEQEINLWNLSKTRGYTPKLRKCSIVKENVYFTVPASGSNNVSASCIPTLKAGSAIMSDGGVVFELMSDINMSSSIGTSNMIAAGANYYALKASGLFKSGKLISTTSSINSYQKYRRIALQDNDVVDVIDVYDSYGNKYYKVDDLSQDVVYERISNTSSDSADVPYVLNVKKVPYRFSVDVDPETETTYVQFGAGNSSFLSSSLLVPDPALYAISFTGDSTTLPVPAINPEYFTGSLSLGIVPDTNVIIRYRVGGGDQSNVGANSIRQPYDVNVEFPSYNSTDTAKQQDVINSFACVNVETAEGGGGKDDIDTVRFMAKAAMNSQRRLVDPSDFIARVLSMPSAFGSIYKCAVEPINDSNTVKIYLLSKDSSGNLKVPSYTLKQNIREWISLNRLGAQGIDLEDGEIINLSLKYSIVVDKKVNSSKVLYACTLKLKEFLATDKRNLGEPIVISDVIELLSQIESVYGVDKVEFVENYATNYPSKSKFKIKRYMKSNILYCPPYSCFEILNPNTNIIGNAV